MTPQVECIGGPLDGATLPDGGEYIIVQCPKSTVAYLYKMYWSLHRLEDRRYCLVSSKLRANPTIFSGHGAN